LNGTEVFRTNMPTGTITAATLATNTVTGMDETNWIRAALSTNALVSGINVLAAEVHQAATNSSDLGFDLELSALLQPRLTITRSGTNGTLRWPASAPGFRVQSTNALGSPSNWPSQPGTPSVTNGSYELPVPA